jgi:hypothetical protein
MISIRVFRHGSLFYAFLSKVSFYTTVYEALSFHSQVIHTTNLITPEAIEIVPCEFLSLYIGKNEASVFFFAGIRIKRLADFPVWY